MNLSKGKLLQLDKESMRQLGYQAIDALVEHYETVPDKPVVSPLREGDCLPQELKIFPATAQDPSKVLETALGNVFKDVMQIVHPRFYAYIPGPSNFVSAIADFVSSGYNIFAGTTPNNLGAYEVEHFTIRWLCDLVGMDENAGGLFVSGGSVASLTGLTVARHIKLNDDISNSIIYCSKETHSSIDRALFILGFKKENIHEIAIDENMRMIPAELSSAVATDKAAGKKPFCVVGTAGTTNIGAVDPLDELATICKKESLWFHIDAAYGGGGLLAKSVREQFTGIEQADTVALDPHKWLFQSIECGCILVRDPKWLKNTFRRLPDYMRDTDTGPETMNYRDMSPQVTRAFKAFKLWLSLQVFGTDAFSEAVEYGLELARLTQKILEERECWEVVTPATLGIVTFRYRKEGLSNPELDEFNGVLIELMTEDGFAFCSSTILFGKKVIRMCPLHPRLTQDDIVQTIEKFEELAELVNER